MLLEDAVSGNTRITFEVRDEKGVGWAKALGSAFVLLADLLRHAGCARTYTFGLCGSDNANARLRLRVGILAVVNADDGPPLWQTRASRGL
jgi:hypothetical protein